MNQANGLIKKKGSNITMKDVAARAGVTSVVVSKVLHGKASNVRVSAGTAERVKIAAEELGYRVNVWAQNFRNQETKTIGILHGIGFGRPLFSSGSHYFSVLMDGIVEGAFAYDLSVTLCPKLLQDNPEVAINDGRFDGLVWYSTTPNPVNHRLVLECQMPLVIIHAHAAQYEYRHPTIICDNRQGIRNGLNHLVELGHEKIAFISVPSDSALELQERAHAVQAESETLGIEKAEWVKLADYDRSIEEYLRSNRRATGILLQHDGLAPYVYQAAARLGIRIPEDVSVVGFDSTPFCEQLRPSLTSISQPLSLMGEKAIDLLVERINNPSSLARELVIPCGLDVRESTSSNVAQVIYQ